ncbi:hypothetical protein ACFZDJ_44270 [Streptomyces sp. NPDC007896]|uniref:hypothetical protein n=1 Tax=Streptomyces sp. NPDC007896 TaxID=3364784 RepID=UPI0036EC7FE3
MEIGRNPAAEPSLPDPMADVARGDQQAFTAVYDVVADDQRRLREDPEGRPGQGPQ